MKKTASTNNKAFVLTAFDTLFNRCDYKGAETFWSPDDIQHCANVPQGRDGRFDLIKSLAPSLKYEHDVVMAEDDRIVADCGNSVRRVQSKIGRDRREGVAQVPARLRIALTRRQRSAIEPHGF
jgi:hypothetical protein